MKKTVKGELTVFFSLTFLLLLALVGAVIESASIQVSKNEKRADASRAVESVFAEYQKNLMERYGIFALEGSYDTGQISEENVLNRLSFYGAENMEKEIVSIRYLTDNQGSEFYRQAVENQKTDLSIVDVEAFLNKTSEWTEKEQLANAYEEEDIRVNEELQEMLEGEEQELPDEDNPLELLKMWKSETFLNLLLSDEFSISDETVAAETLVSKRNLRKGYGTLLEKQESTGDTVFFSLYLLDKFGNATEQEENTFLKYELEYLLEGCENDRENLEAVVRKICNIRFGINYVFLLSNQSMQAEAEAMAGTICALVAVPAITPVLKQALLIAWSYGEAMMDVRELLSGGKVPLVKSQDSWKLSLENLLDIKNSGLPDEAAPEETGMSYQEYLQMLLLTKKKEELCMRALDLAELNLVKGGNSFFKMDACVTGANFQFICSMRRQITYQFQISYQYHQ